MLLQILVLLAITWYFIFRLRRKRLYQLASRFEGPRPLPLIGNALKFVIPVSEMYERILKNHHTYKSPVRFWFGPNLILYITNPEDIKIVLNSPYALTKFPYMYTLAEAILRRGLVCLPVPEWKRHRRLISPSFSQTNLEDNFERILRYSTELVDNLKGEAGKGDFNPLFNVSRSALGSILEVFLGLELDEGFDACEILQLLKILLSGAFHRLTNIFYMSDFVFKRTQLGKKYVEADKKFRKILNAIVERCQNESKQPEENAAGTTSEGKPLNVIERLLTAEASLTAEDVLDEVNTIIITGLDSTAVTFSYLMIMLGMHPKIQEKVHQEIKGVLNADEMLKWQNLDKLVYLDRVIKEVLRLFPIMAGVGRYTTKELKLENHTVPIHTNILIGTLGVHRDPIIWNKPDKFDPDRFSPEEEAKRHPYSWIPFSGGARNCIGYKYAQIVLKTFCVEVLKNYKIETPYRNMDDLRLTIEISVVPIDGYKVSITSRTRFCNL